MRAVFSQWESHQICVTSLLCSGDNMWNAWNQAQKMGVYCCWCPTKDPGWALNISIMLHDLHWDSWGVPVSLPDMESANFSSQVWGKCGIPGGTTGASQAGQHLQGRCGVLGWVPQKWYSDFVLGFHRNTYNFCGKGCSDSQGLFGCMSTETLLACAVMATEKFGAFRGAK